MENENDFLRNALGSAFASALGPKTAAYAAVPVTSGPRLWRLAKDLGVSDLSTVQRVAPNRLKREVLSPNCVEAAEFARAARARHRLVIDPSRLVIPEWSQKQYWKFWEDIILQYVTAVLLSPGWAYSRGCVYECLFAIQNSIPVLSAEDQALNVQALRNVAFKAIRERDSLGIKAGFLDEFITATAQKGTQQSKQPGRNSG